MEQPQNTATPAGGLSELNAGLDFGGAGAIPPAEVKCLGDEFENHIRRIGVVFACEWFGHARDSEFTRETIKTLIERSNEKVEEPCADLCARSPRT